MHIISKNSFQVAVAALIVSLYLLSCKSETKSNQESENMEVIPENIVEMRDDQIKAANIEMGTIEMRSLSGTLKVSGLVFVSPQNYASVCAPMGGFVKSTDLLPGNQVKKGQILATIENQEFVEIQQSYIETKNKLEFAEAEFKRHSELYKEDVYSQKNLQQVTSDFKNLKAQLNALEQKLALIGMNPAKLEKDDISSTVSITSPINGYVKAVNVNLGKFVGPSDIVCEIINSDKLLLELTLFEKDADKVAVGQKIHFFINNETEQHGAVIYQTGKSVNADKTYKVYASITEKCSNILHGMYVNANIETSGNKVTALPSEAVVSFADKDYIFVFDNNKVEEGKPFTEYRIVEVHKGISDNGYTEIVLPDGFDISKEKVVVKGAYNLLSAKKNAGGMAC